MSNHAYESAAALRPSSNGPVPISTLSERFSLAPASAEDAAALNDLSILGVSVDSGDTAPGELFVGLPGFTVHGARFAAEAAASGAVAVLTDADGAQIVHESAPGTPVLVHDVELDVSVGHEQRLGVGVHGDELHATQIGLDHAVDGIDAAAADTDDLDLCLVVL